MDKNKKFTPTREEACKIADDYWNDLSDYREKFLDFVSEWIPIKAQQGEYEFVDKVLKTEKEYIKEKLEDVGYTVLFSDYLDDERYQFIKVYFNKK